MKSRLNSGTVFAIQFGISQGFLSAI